MDDTEEYDGYYPSQEISRSDHAFMMTLSSLSNSTESRTTANTVVEELIDDGPVKTVVPPSPIKVMTEYESGDDDLVEQVRADRTARELAAVNAARRGEVLYYRGYPQVTMSTTNELVIESMTLAQWADIYCHYALHEEF